MGKINDLMIGLGKTQSQIPWLTIKSYVEVGLEAVGLTDYTVEVKEQQGLVVLWDAYWVEISALSSSFGRKQLLFQIKLFKTGFNPPVAIEFKQEYKDIATVCSNFLSTFLIQREIDVMEAEWAAESAAEDATAEALLEQGKAIAVEQAQLEHEESGWL